MEVMSRSTGIAYSESKLYYINAGCIITREFETLSLIIREVQYKLSSGEALKVYKNGDLLKQNINYGNKLNSFDNLKLLGSSFLYSANLATSFMSILSNHLITSVASSENVLKIEYLVISTAAVSQSKPYAISRKSSGLLSSL